MVKIPVYLRDMYDAKHLVQIAESCRGDVDLLCGRYVVDAKSIQSAHFRAGGNKCRRRRSRIRQRKAGKPESDPKIK